MNQKLICSLVLLVSLFGFISGQGETCITCTSQNDLNCLLSPGDMPGVACSPANNNTCFSRILNGHVVRGCGETLAVDLRANCSLSTSDCETCIQISALPGVPCNNALFPPNRLRCHQCEGHLNTTCGQTPTTNPTTCNLFTRDDGCFVRRNGENVIRGCLSSPNSCPEGRCLRCPGHGCNIQNGMDAEIPDESSAMGQKGNSLVLAFATVFSVFALKKYF